MNATKPPFRPGQRVRVTDECAEWNYRGREGTVETVKEVLPGAFEVLVDLGLAGRRTFAVMPGLGELELARVERFQGGHDGLEDELVTQIVATLGDAGYEVCVVGQRKAKGSGTTVGYPDLSVRSPHWPVGMAMLMEAKTATGELSVEQEKLHARGWSVVVRSVDDALAAAQNGDAWLVIGGRARS